MDGTICSVSVRLPPFLLPLVYLRCPLLSTQLTPRVQIVAGMVSLANDFQIARFGHRLGFLNPLLYSRRFGLYGFKDIKYGFNPGCGTDGFASKAGWDPVRSTAPVSSSRVIFDVG